MKKILLCFISVTFVCGSAFASEKLEAKPGKPSIYRIVTALEGPYKGEKVIDLGFSNYFKFGNMDEFRTGDIIYAAPVKQSKKGLATQFYFERAVSHQDEEKPHIVTHDKTPVFADERDLYTYKANSVKVVDGDTITAVLDLGFGFTALKRLRLRGIDAPEQETPEGIQAKEYLELLVKPGDELLIQTFEPDKYGRYLADVWRDGRYLNQDLVDRGFADRVEA